MSTKVAIYARLSPGEQAPTTSPRSCGLSPRACIGTSRAEYMDHDLSGAKGRDRRLAYDRLYDAIVRRKIDLVMAWSVDRLGRSLQ